MNYFLIIVGLIFCYFSSSFLAISLLKDFKQQLKVYDLIIAFIPIVRDFYLIISIGCGE